MTGRSPKSPFPGALGLALFFAAGVCVAAPAPEGDRPSAAPERFEASKRLYEKQCAACHGVTGRGDGAAAYLAFPKPRDFTRDEYRLISTDQMAATDQDLFRTLTRGMPGSSMPSWESLPPGDRWGLVEVVRYLQEAGKKIDAGELTQAEADAGLPWEKTRELITAQGELKSVELPPEPLRSDAGVEQGRRIYAQACAACHGPQGKGDGPQAMEDSAGFPIRPRDLTAGIFKGSSDGRDLYYRVIAGLPGSPMPAYAGVYTDEEVWRLVHYLQSLAPPGAEERVRLRPVDVRAGRVEGEIPWDPSADAWEKAIPVEAVLAPLWWRDERVAQVEVKALHNGEELAILLSWLDSTRDVSAGKPQDFPDGVAVQFSAQEDPPFFGMGDPGGAVQIWHWKASWDEDREGWKDIETTYPDAVVDWYPEQSDYKHGDPFEVRDAKTSSQRPLQMTGWGAGNPLSDPGRPPAEEAVAQGVGTLTAHPPVSVKVEARGVWGEGRWRVILRRPLEGNSPGKRVAFAVWDGHAEDRNGQKSFSVWNELTLE